MKLPLLAAGPDMRELRELPILTWNEWDVERIMGALAAHDAGFFFESAMLVDYLYRDDAFAASAEQRSEALGGLPFSMVAPDTADKRTTKGIVKEAEAMWPSCCSPEVAKQLVKWGTSLGFALAEICWDTSDGESWKPWLKVWHPSQVRYDMFLRRFIVNTMDGQEVITPGDGKWFLYTPHGEYRGWIHGLVRSLAFVVMIRQYLIRDGGRTIETVGQGVRKGIVPAEADPKVKAKFFRDLRNLGENPTLVCPTYIDNKGTERAFDFTFEGADIATAAASAITVVGARCDSAIQLGWLRQNLTSQVKEGSFAAARVHGDVKQDCLESDERTLGGGGCAQVVRPWCAYNFGRPDDAPRPTWEVEPPEDLASAAKTSVDASTALTNFNNVGLAQYLDLKKFCDRFKLELKDGIDADDIVLAPPAPAGAPASSGADPFGSPSSGAPHTPSTAPVSPHAPATTPGALSMTIARSGVKELLRKNASGQAFVDGIADEALAAAPAALKEILSAVGDAIASSSSYDQLRSRLVALSKRYPNSDLTDLVERSVQLAFSAGTLIATHETEQAA